MTLNELLVEWSYRTEKGYPDLGNPSDILVLKEILERLELPTDILDELEDDEPEIDDSGEIDDLEPNPEEEKEEEEEKKLQQYIDQISCPFNQASAKAQIKNPNLDLYLKKIRT